MSFNPSKCHIPRVTRKRVPFNGTYHLKGYAFETVDNATYLGVDVDNVTYLGVDVSMDLGWYKHSSKVQAKGNRTLGFVK